MAQKSGLYKLRVNAEWGRCAILRLYLWRFWCYNSGNFRKVRAVQVLPAYRPIYEHNSGFAITGTWNHSRAGEEFGGRQGEGNGSQIVRWEPGLDRD